MPQHVTHLLTAYLHEELPAHLQARVTRHVEQCDACYAALSRERELARTLSVQMPAFGSPRPEQLARLLPGILAEVVPEKPAVQRPPFRLPAFGLAVVLSLALVLMVPALVLPRVSAVNAPDQPAPYMIVATATQSVTDAPVMHMVSSPTAVAVRRVATDPPALNPSPVPEMRVTPDGK